MDRVENTKMSSYRKGMPHGGGLRTYTFTGRATYGRQEGGDGLGGVLITDVTESRAMNPNKDYPKRNACLTLPYRSVVSCTRLTTSPCHLFRSSAALFSW